MVTDQTTQMTIAARKVASREHADQPKWAILTEKNKYRYFTQKDVDTCLLRKQITARTPEELNRRNNVEATIFQLGYHYSNAKSRYRGLIKHKMFANCRCFWINFVRIARFLTGSSPDYALKSANSRFPSLLCYQNVKIWQMLSLFLEFIARCRQDVAFLGKFLLFPLASVEKSTFVMVFKK